MTDDRRRILDMLAAGKITAEQAETLLDALNPSTAPASPPAASPSGARFKYLRVLVEPAPGSEHAERVNIRVPLKLIRAGLKWAALIPGDARDRVERALHEKGVAVVLDKLKPEDLEELVSNLDDLTVDVEGRETVRIFCE